MELGIFGRSGAWVLAVSFVCAGAGCSAEQRESSGELTVPLKTTGRSGATYYLRGTFLIRDTNGATVAALSTADNPEAQLLSTDLDVGQYTVELLPSWSLERVLSGEPAIVPATLSSESVVEVSITEDQVTVAVFRFSTGDGDIEFTQGTLGVAIEVEELVSCGNGIVDPGEACDAGANAGEFNGCDGSCEFQCEGPCPLRVDPGAGDGGDGSSWSSPIKYIQAAIDIQSAFGGGEVWVKGPGPFETLTGNPTRTLIELGKGVHLYGGFIGTEVRLEQRDDSFRTIIAGVPWSESDEEELTPLIMAASNTILNGFKVLGHTGAVLVLQDAQDFRVSNVTIESVSSRRESHLKVLNSTGVFESLDLRKQSSIAIDRVAGIEIRQSRVRLRDCEFVGLHAVISSFAGIRAVDSTLALERVDFVENKETYGHVAGLAIENSDVFAWDSKWLRNFGESPTLGVYGSRFVAVNSHFEGNRSASPTAMLYGASRGIFLNTSFVGNSFFSAASTAGILSGSELEVVNGSFVDNYVYGSAPDISSDQLSVYNTYSNRGQLSVVQPYTGGGNCFLDKTFEPYLRTDAGYTQVFLRDEFGCTDSGDEAAAEDATRRAWAFAEMVGSTVLPDEDWWSRSTSVFPVCFDPGPIDPGRHHAVSFCE